MTLRLACLLLAAVPAMAGCLDHVDARVYAHNHTGEMADVHVVVAREGRVVLDERAFVPPSQGPASNEVLLGHVRGSEGDYAWMVTFGNRTATGTERLEDHMGPMGVILLPDGLEVSFALA